MFFSNVLFSTLVFVAAAGAAVTGNATSIISKLLSCALPCIPTTNISPELLAHPKYICLNNSMELSLSVCIRAKCSYPEQRALADIGFQLCEGLPRESRSMAIAIFGFVLAPLAVLAVAMRFYSRISISRELGVDDWLMLVGAGLVVTIIGINTHNCLTNGFGLHIWNIDPSRIVSLMQIFYACEILYLIAMTCIKSSILIFYLRVFPNKWFWVADVVVLIATIAAGAANMFAVVLQCTPISGAWNPSPPTQCVNLSALAVASGSIAVFLDIVVLILPIPELIRLRTNKKKKYTVSIMFSLGAIACITSIIRLKYLVDYVHSMDPTFDYAYAAIWTLLEMSIAIICSCLPVIRSLLSHVFPSMVQRTIPEDEQSHEDGTHKIPSLHHFARLEKTGPSYNKWVRSPVVAITPEPIALDGTDIGMAVSSDKPEEGEVKIWIHPKFNRQDVIATSPATSLWCLEGPRLSEDVERTLGLRVPSPAASQPCSSLRASSGIDIAAAGRTLGLGLGLGNLGWGGGSTRTSMRSSIRDSSTADTSIYRRTGSPAPLVGTSWTREMVMVRDIEAGYMEAEVGSVQSATRTFLSSVEVKKVRHGMPKLHRGSKLPPQPIGQRVLRDWI